jgi:hypothetical protein
VSAQLLACSSPRRVELPTAAWASVVGALHLVPASGQEQLRSAPLCASVGKRRRAKGNWSGAPWLGHQISNQARGVPVCVGSIVLTLDRLSPLPYPLSLSAGVHGSHHGEVFAPGVALQPRTRARDAAGATGLGRSSLLGAQAQGPRHASVAGGGRPVGSLGRSQRHLHRRRAPPAGRLAAVPQRVRKRERGPEPYHRIQVRGLACAHTVPSMILGDGGAASRGVAANISRGIVPDRVLSVHTKFLWAFVVEEPVSESSDLRLNLAELRDVRWERILGSCHEHGPYAACGCAGARRRCERPRRRTSRTRARTCSRTTRRRATRPGITRTPCTATRPTTTTRRAEQAGKRPSRRRARFVCARASR